MVDNVFKVLLDQDYNSLIGHTQWEIKICMNPYDIDKRLAYRLYVNYATYESNQYEDTNLSKYEEKCINDMNIMRMINLKDKEDSIRDHLLAISKVLKTKSKEIDHELSKEGLLFFVDKVGSFMKQYRNSVLKGD